MKYSFIIPCYNSSKWICNAIESIKNQKGYSSTDIEIIVVNDGSSDDTCELVERRHKDVTLINKVNGGVSSARNEGVKCARGKYIIFLDSDDVFDDRLIEELNLTFDSDVDFLSWGFRIINIDETCDTRLAPLTCDIRSAEDFVELFFHKEVYQSICTICIKKDVIEKNNIFFDERCHYAEDLNFQIRVMMHSCNCIYIDKVLFEYRKRSGSGMIGASVDRILESFEFFEETRSIVKKQDLNVSAFDQYIAMYFLYELFNLYSRKLLKGQTAEFMKEKMFLLKRSHFSFENIKISTISLSKILYIPLYGMLWGLSKKK